MLAARKWWVAAGQGILGFVKTEANDSTAKSLTYDLANLALRPGDIVLLFQTIEGENFADTAPTGYTNVGDGFGSSPAIYDGNIQAAYKVMTATPDSSVTWDMSAATANAPRAGYAIGIRGYTYDSQGDNNANDIVNPPAVTVTSDDSLVIVAGAVFEGTGGPRDFGVNTNYTQLDFDGFATTSLNVQYREGVATGTENPGAWYDSGSANNGTPAISISFTKV